MSYSSGPTNLTTRRGSSRLEKVFGSAQSIRARLFRCRLGC